MMKKMKKLGMLVLALFTFGFSCEATAVKYAAFDKADKSMEFADVVKGNHSEFIASMEAQGARMLALTNIPQAKNNDVIVLQASMLREEAGALGDFGFDCSLVYKEGGSTDAKGDHFLSGICHIMRKGGEADIQELVTIKRVPIRALTAGHEEWVKIAEHKELGIAFYATTGSE